MSERLWGVLKARGVQRDTLEKMQNEKIDEDVIIEMTDEELSEYIPRKGDRVVVKAFVRKENSETQTQKRKFTLLESLRSRMAGKSGKKTARLVSDSEEEYESSAPGPSDGGQSNSTQKSAETKRGPRGKKAKEASTSSRSLIVGFSVYEATESRYKQVRAPMGGGIRHITVDKNTPKRKLLHTLCPLFFQDGKNCHGSLGDFQLDVSTDVHGSQPVHENETIQHLIDRLGLKHVRCYLLAKSVDLDEDKSASDPAEDSLEDLPDMFAHRRRRGEENLMPTAIDSSQEEVPSTSDGHHISHGQPNSERYRPLNQGDEMTVDNEVIVQTADDSSPSNNPLLSEAAEDRVELDVQSVFAATLDSDAVNLTPPTYNIPDEFIQEDQLARLNDDDSGIIQFGPFPAAVELDLNATQPLVKEIKVHRGNVCQEMVTFFSKEENVNLRGTTFEVKMLKSDGSTEMAEDNGGVLRDALTEFFDSFYLQYTIGNSVAVPVLRHDMTKVHWSAVGEVIRLAFRQEGILPVRLALPFMQLAFFGKPDDPLDAFMQLLPDVDRLLLEDAMRSVSSVDADDLMDFMERHDARRNLTDENIEKSLTEMENKEMLQVPLFVALCWRPKLKSLGLSRLQLRQIYDNLKPSTRKVLNILEFPKPMNTEEGALSSSLKRLVREMDQNLLGLFLRFCTGSDLAVREKITTRFTESEIRCPTAHTCGCVLNIPRSYAALPYITLKSEFTTLLRNRYWQMDII
ncbi:uncharacterized protein LOC119742010 [Patiria miniata]|uniref:HECT domain-containing protein n=1 Tax=Patiria miniata TaxID=46514 RepID=A0A914BDL9_PATMI|nr:uncharacterized protein LOC119742010 [Patiria miniata]XP_038073946.1 uncharacterized protein LOC119742010 [Patiria miniata]